jgi:hypothetical protein
MVGDDSRAVSVDAGVPELCDDMVIRSQGAGGVQSSLIVL